MNGLPEKAAPPLFNRSFTLTATLEAGDEPCEGMLVSVGGRFGGLALYVIDSKPVFCYNFSGGGHTFVRSDAALTAGSHEVVCLEFDYDGGGMGKGGSATLPAGGVGVPLAEQQRIALAVH